MNTMRKKYCSLPYEPIYLSKQACLDKARILRHTRVLEEMSEKEIAREIFFHAVVCRLCEKLERWHIRLRYLKAKADPIDLSDARDTLFRRFCFRVVWLFPGRRDDV